MYSKIDIEAKNGTENELLVKGVLEGVIKKYPCPIFTDKVLIEQKVVPHSHPILTLNTRNTDPILVLDAFTHEQFHWFCVTRPRYKDCIFYLKKYPDLGDCNKSGTYPNSFWEHLIVNWNTRNFLQNNLTKDQVDFIDGQWQPYPLTEKFVQDNFEVLKNELARFGMVYVPHQSDGGEIVKKSMYSAAESLRAKYSGLSDFVRAVGKFIPDHAHTIPVEERIRPKSILESRFTPAGQAFATGMLSCGSIVNISAEMIRHVGLKVKLIHGETDQSVDHAWISVLNPQTEKWEEYDLTRSDGAITPQHIKKLEANSWEEIRTQIEEDHNTLRERREKRGIK